MNPSTQNAQESCHGKLALALCLGGATLALLIGLGARAMGYDVRTWAFALFAAFQIAAIVIGWSYRHEPLGRASAITASILLLLSVFGLG